jgi:putative peptide zinc metalloprotease protein
MALATAPPPAPAVPPGFPALRADVEFVIRPGSGRHPTYLVEDRFTGAVYELGEREVFLARQLDGQTSLPRLAGEFAEEFGTPVALEDLEAFVRHLAALGLLEGAAAPRITLPEILSPDELLPVARIRLLRGDRLVSWLGRRLAWVWSRPVAWAVAAVTAAGLAVGLLSAPRLLDSIAQHWSLTFVVSLLLLGSAVVHVPRALLHGVLAKRYGAQISGIGVTLIYYVIPWFYCDWSDIAWVRSRARRLEVIAVGLYYQGAVLAVAAIAWRLTEPGTVNSLWLALLTSTGIGLLVFTGNPLVKMEGYLLLATWLEIPRLRERALAALGAWMARRPPPEPLSPRQWRWFILYALCCFVYALGHWVLLVALMGQGLTAAYGAGGAAATVLLAAFLAQRPLGRFLGGLWPVRWLMSKDGGMRRWTWRVGIVLVIAVLLLLPYPYETGGPFNIVPALRAEVHCEIDGGRVGTVLIREGERVSAGQPLARLDPREYERNVKGTESRLDEARAKLELMRKELYLLQNPPNIEAIHALEAEIRQLDTLLGDYRRQLELTVLRSPIEGRVTTPLIEQFAGKYLKQGDLFATVEQADSVQVEIYVPEADVPQVKVGAPVKVVAWAYPYETFHGQVADIAPLAVPTPGTVAPEKASVKSVRVVAQMPNPDLRLKTQLTGFAKIKAEKIPVGLVLSRLLARWFAVQVWYWLP